jgi:hypothetical protein
MQFHRFSGGLNFNITVSCITRLMEPSYAQSAQNEAHNGEIDIRPPSPFQRIS